MDKKVLLIADDVEMNRAVIKRFFQREFDILEAGDGHEVMQVLENQKVDVLLLDIIMPEMNGLEVLQEIKKNSAYENVAILVATSTKEKTERVALQYGADDVVAKPYDPMVIHKRLDNIVAKKKLEILYKNSDIEEQKHILKQQLFAEIKEELEKAVTQVKDLGIVMKDNAENEQLIAEYAENLVQKCDTLVELVK